MPVTLKCPCGKTGGTVFEEEPPPPSSGRRIIETEKPFEEAPAFPLPVLGMIYRPAFILEYFRGWPARPVVLIEIVLLYGASLAALGWVAAAGYSGPRVREPDAMEPSPQPGLPLPGTRKKQGEVLVWKALPETMGIEAHADPEFPEAG